jgi:hypothetical protein
MQAELPEASGPVCEHHTLVIQKNREAGVDSASRRRMRELLNLEVFLERAGSPPGREPLASVDTDEKVRPRSWGGLL